METESNIIHLSKIPNNSIGQRAQQIRKAVELWLMPFSKDATGQIRLQRYRCICQILHDNRARISDIGADEKTFQHSVWLAMFRKVIEENQGTVFGREEIPLLINIVDHRFKESETWPDLNHRHIGLTTSMIAAYYATHFE